jgi:hypothetical protein
MRRKTCFIVTIVTCAVCAVFYFTLTKNSKRSLNPGSMTQPEAVAIDFSKRVPVANNRGRAVLDGFQGEVHPVLQRSSNLEVTATLNFDRNQSGDITFLHSWPFEVNDLFLSLNLSILTKAYTERDFSRFLPEKELGAVGQMWALDPEKVAEFLKQFHPNPSMRLVARGRRAGPDGAFAILRAVSPSHLDILFRVHAEFDVVPDHEKWKSLVSEAWFSPAYLLGRLVINREAGTVEYFRLGIPTDTRLNVHITAANEREEGHGWMHVDSMELTGGNADNLGKMRWVDQIETTDANERLAKVFYKFKEIDWVAFDRVGELAREKKKPIFIVAAMGTLDDQTC